MTPHLEVDVQAIVGSFSLDVAFSADNGTVAILGASGAGKTMTLRAIAGLLRPSRGRVRLGERLLYDSVTGIDVPTRHRRIGYVFQEYALFPHLSVAENIAFGLHGAPRKEASAVIRRLARMLGLAGLEERRPRQLSGGQRQRVALGRALAPQPDLLLLDEPFSSLDAPTRSALVGEFADLQERLATPALLVTHDYREAFTLARHVVIMTGGRVVQYGPPAGVLARPATVEAARLVGVRNIVDARAGDADAQGQWFHLGDAKLRAQGHEPFAPGSVVKVGFRPEDIELVHGTAAMNAITCRLGHVDGPSGPHSAVFRMPNDAVIEAILGRSDSARLPGAGGSSVTLAIPPEALHVWAS